MSSKNQLTLFSCGQYPLVDPETCRRFEPGEELTKVEINSWIRTQYAAGIFKDAPDCEDANAAALAAESPKPKPTDALTKPPVK